MLRKLSIAIALSAVTAGVANADNFGADVVNEVRAPSSVSESAPGKAARGAGIADSVSVFPSLSSPSSVSESAPWRTGEASPARDTAVGASSGNAAVGELSGGITYNVVTPSSVSESAPWLTGR